MSRVVHITSQLDPRTGGVAKAVLDLSRAQAKAGLNVSVFATYPDKDQAPEVVKSLQGEGIKAIAIGPVRGKLQTHPQTISALKTAITAADVVHIHAVWEDVQHQAAVVSMRLGKPFVWSPHGMLDPWSLRQSKWKKRAIMLLRTRRDLNHAAALHYTTTTERDLAQPLNLRPPAIVETLGVDFAEFDAPPASGAFRAKFPLIAGRRIVLFMSRVHYKKGLDLLLPAFAKVASESDVLVIAGPVADGYQPVLDKLVQDHGLAGQIIFTGMLVGSDRIASLLDAAMFVLPSYQENFGLAAAEALAAGCPSIISDQVNIAPLVSAAGAGAVVPTRIDSLADILKKWLENDTLRFTAAENGKKLAREKFDWPGIAQRWTTHYQHVLDTHRP